MSWTYSGDPSASPLDALRFAVGDTQARRPLLTDQELMACLNQAANNPSAAGVLACRAIVFQLARKRNESIGSVSIQYAQEYEHYTALLTNLEAQGGLAGSFSVYAGGTSLADSDAILADRDRIPLGFGSRRRRPFGDSLLAASPDAPGGYETDERH